MTILYEYVAGSEPSLAVSIILWGLALILFTVTTILVFTDKGIKYVCLYLFVVLAAVGGELCIIDTRCHMVKALINDTIPYTEVCEHYEYVSREGDIWTLKVLEEKGE